MTRRKAAPAPSQYSTLIRATALLAFLVEVIFVQETISPFRSPKMLLALSGIAILGAAAMIQALARGRLRFAWGTPAKLLVLLPLIQALSAFWAPTPFFSLRTAMVTALWIGAAFVLAVATPEDRRFILRWTLAGAVVSGAVLMAQALGIEAFRLKAYAAGNRLGLSGLAGNPADYAIGALFLLPFLLVELRDKPKNKLLWATSTFLLLAALLSQNMTALLAVLCLAAWAGLRPASKRNLGTVGLLILLGLTILMLSPVRQRFQKQWTRLEEGNYYALLSGRDDGWSAAITMVQRAPFNGIGAGQFSREFYPARLAFLQEHDLTGHRGEMATHFEWAHNDLLQLEAELGLMGGLWMLLFGLALIRGSGRRKTLLFSFGAVALPFLILHYPTHIALGLLPLTLLLAELLHESPTFEWRLEKRYLVIPLALGLIAGAVFSTGFNISSLSLERWRGVTEGALGHIGEAPADRRNVILASIEKQAATQMLKHPRESYWLWRVIGRVRLDQRDAAHAEAAFQRAFSLFPHEEAEMGLGLALAAQDRLSEALYHLGRVCRLNPMLLRLIPDTALRTAVRREFAGSATMRFRKARIRASGKNRSGEE